MRWIICLSVYCLFSASSCLADDAYIHKLEEQLAGAKADSTKVRICAIMSEYLAPTDSVRSLALARQSLQFAERANAPISFSRANAALGRWYLAYKQYSRAEDYYRQALTHLEYDTTKAALRLTVVVTANLGVIEGLKGNAFGEMQHYTELIPVIRRLGDTGLLAVVYNNMGIKFANLRQFRRAATYFSEALKITAPDTANLANTAAMHINMAWCFLELDSLPQMKTYLDKAHAQLKSLGEDHFHWPNFYLYHGLYLARQHQAQPAMDEYKKGIVLARRYTDELSVANLLLSMAALDTTYTPATTGLLEESYQLARKNGYQMILPEILRNLINVHIRRADLRQAFEYQREYIQLHDSIKENELTYQMNELEQKFQLAENEKKILRLENENTRKEFALQQNRLFNYFLILGLLALAAVSALIYLLYRNNRRTFNQKEIIHQLEMQEIQQTHHIENLSFLLEGQEQERSRLARDLHDGLGGMLSGLKIGLSAISAAATTPRLNEQVTRLIHMLDRSMDEMRAISRSMAPGILNRDGLVAAVKAFCTDMSRDGLNIQFDAYQVSREIAPSRQLSLYRVIQELINNAVKHARCDQIFVQIQEDNGVLFISVEDNGTGNPAGRENSPPGAGIENIRQRVALLNGNIDFYFNPGKGTAVNIECPIQ